MVVGVEVVLPLLLPLPSLLLLLLPPHSSLLLLPPPPSSGLTTRHLSTERDKSYLIIR